MKNARLYFLALGFVLSLAAFASAQGTLPGDVVEVLDGRTVVLEIQTGRATIELQYIDVPTTGPMAETVKRHLRNLVFKKRVEYRARSLSFDRTIGQIFVGGVDVSQQLLRDGAAWHTPSELSGQDATEFAQYASIEASAKKEKRGVWSKPDLKPSWEQPRRETTASTRAIVSSTRRQLAKPGYWGDKNPKMGDIGALFNGYNAASKKGYLSTGLGEIPVEKFAAYDDRYQNAKLAADVTYYYKESDKGREGDFVFTLMGEADVPLFAKNQQLVLATESARYSIGKGKRTETRKDGRVFEKVTFIISRSNMERMTNDVSMLMIGDHMIEPYTVRYWLYNMLQLSK